MLNVKEKLNEVIEMQEELGNPFIAIHKPKAKNKIVEYDSDTCAFDIVEDKLLFEFFEIEGFSVKLNNIVDVIIQKFKEMVLTTIKLRNGNSILIHEFI